MEENLINRAAVASGLPITPIVPNPDMFRTGGRSYMPESVGEVEPRKYAAETWMDALSRTKVGKVEELPLSSVYIGNRYDKTIPGTDYEEMAAQQQPWTEKAAHGLGKMGVLAGTTFIQSTVGLVNGAVQWGKTGRAAAFFDNDLNRWVDEVNKRKEDQWANYYTQAEKDAHWYAPSKLLSANFFWDGIIKNMGFSIGVIGSAALGTGVMGSLSKLLGSIPKVGKLFSVGKAAEALQASEEALKTATTGQRATSMLGKFMEVNNKFLNQYNTLNPVSRGLVNTLSTSGEATFEAYQNMNQFRDAKIQEYKDSHFGMAPMGAELENINKQTDNIGKSSYLLNAALLTFTNYVQLPKILGASYAAEKGMSNGIIREIGDIVKEQGKYIGKKATGGKILSTIKAIRPYTFSASEAFEEGAQYAITKGTEDYFNKKYNDVPTDFLDSVIEGISETISTDEGMENVMIGGLSGAMMIGGSKLLRGEIRQKNRNTAQAITEFNKHSLSDFTKDTNDAVRRAHLLSLQREGKIEEGSIIDSKDLEYDYIINYLTPRLKYGRYDLVRSDIEEYRQLASTEEGFNQLVREGKALDTDTRPAFLNRLSVFEQTAEHVKTLYQTLNLRYAGIVDKDKKRVYSSQSIDKMVYALSKISDYDRRIPTLIPKLSLAGIDVDAVMTDLIDGKSDKFNQAVDIIKTLKIGDRSATDEEKTDIGIALDDVAEMTLRRNKFLQEYDDIKKHPEKYDEKPVIPTKEENETPKPNTIKAGDSYYEIGKEYHLGKNIEQVDDTGKIIKFPSVISIIGESEDKNSLLVKDKDGNIISIPKTEVELYGLINPSEKAFNSTLNFFMRNRDRKVKDKKGTEGSLEYNPKTGTLTFNYNNDKGETKSTNITLKDFKDNKFVFDTDLTAEDNIDIEKFAKKFNIKDRINTVLGEHERQFPPTANNSSGYEPDAKKPTNLLVPSSANPNDGTDDTKRGDAFGFRLPFILQDIANKKRKGSIKGVYLTKKTEDLLGLTGFIDQMLDKAKRQGKDFNPEEAIYLVAVDNSTGKYIPVDEFGEPITENVFEKIVFQPLFKELVWDKKWGVEETGEDKTPFRKYVTPEQREIIKKNYADYRSKILNTPSVIEHNIQASFGFPLLNRVVDEHGVEGGKDRSVRTSVEDAGLTSQEEMRTKPLIVIPKTDDGITQGSTTFNKPKGKPFLALPNALVPLMNRKHTKEEASLIYKVIRQYAKYMEDPNIKMSDSNPKALITWLKSVIYWGKPETQEGEAKKAAYNSIYWEVDTDGTFVLQIPQQKYKIEFTVESLERNKDELINKLSSMYLNINSKGTEETSKEYVEITDVDENGEVKKRAWKNYQSFLLSKDFIPSDPTKKVEPRGDSVRLSAIILPITKDRPINREGIYWYVTDNEAEFKVGDIEKPKAQTSPVTHKDIISLSQEDKDRIEAEGGVKAGTEEPYSVFINIGGEDYNFGFGITPDNKIGILPDDDIINALNTEIEKKSGKKPDEKQAVNILKDFVRSLMPAEVIKVGGEVSELEAKKADIERRREKELSKTIHGVTRDFYEDWKKVTGENWKKADILRIESESNEVKEYFENNTIDKINAKYDAELAALEGKPESKPEEKKGSLRDHIRNVSNGKAGPDVDPYVKRWSVESDSKVFETENWKKVEDFLRSKFPNIPVYRVKNIMQQGGRMAWGLFRDGAIYVYQNAEAGTTYHEVFHAVWKLFSDVKEQENILKEFKGRGDKTFFDRRSETYIKYKDATDKQAEEAIAEEFRNYIQKKEIPSKPEKGRPFILKLFADLAAAIRNIFLKPKVSSQIEKMFNDIYKGKYNRRVPYETELSYARSGIIDTETVFLRSNDDLSLASLSDKQRSHVIQLMTYETITSMIENDEDLFIPVKNKGDELYSWLRERVRAYIVNMYAEKIKDLSEEEQNRLFDEADVLDDLVSSSWDFLVKRHKEYLQSYNVEFDENDNIQRKDENKDKTPEYLDATKVDSLRKAHPAIKMLLATVPMTGTDGKWKRNEMGGMNLLPMGRVYINLLNKLHDSRTVEQMLYNLLQMAKKDPNYIALYERLSKRSHKDDVAKDKNTYLMDLSNIGSTHSSRLTTSFWTLMRKSNPEVVNIYVLENGEVVVGDANLSTSASQLRDRYLSGILSKAKQKDSFFKYDYKKKVYIGDADKVKRVDFGDNIGKMVKFLSDIGIEFNANEVSSLDGRRLSKFKEAVQGIKMSISTGKEIVSFSRKALDISGQLLKLGYIEAYLQTPDLDSTYFDINGERNQVYIGTNAASDLYDFISQQDTLTQDSIGNSQYSYLLTDSFCTVEGVDGKKRSSSNIINRMFDNGNRIQDDEADKLLRVVYVGGIDNQIRGRRKKTAKLTYKERLMQELNLNLNGYYLNLVPGDANLGWASYMGNPISEEDVATNMEKVYSIFRDYLASEIDLSREEGRYVAKNRDSKEMRFFKSILGEELHDKLLASEESNSLKIYEDNKTEIDRAIKGFFETQNTKLKDTLTHYGLLRKEDNTYTLDGVGEQGVLSESKLNDRLSFLNINFAIANIEFHKLLYADPFQYEDELKRIKNFLSPRQAIVNNSPQMNAVYNKVWNKDYKEGEDAWTNFTREHYRSVVIKDVWYVIKDLPGYEKPIHPETDGGGIMSFKAHRNLRIRAGQWSHNEELQYRHDMQYEKLKREGATEEELVEFNKKNPNVQSAYTPVKPIVAGNIGGEYNRIVLDKFALFPISERMIDDINRFGNKKGSNMLSLYKKMQKEDIDYIVYESSRKVGASNVQSLYNEETGEFNNDVYPEEAITNIPYSIFSIQTEVPSKEESITTRGTQVTKLVTMDFMEAGVPIDFMKGKGISSRYQAWMEIKDENEREKLSPIYKEIKNNQKLLEAIIDEGYKSLLKRLGIKETITGPNTYDRKYEVVDFSQAATTLRQEMFNREVNDNISQALNSYLEGKTTIESTQVYQQVRNILYSIADKEFLSPKINGKMVVQLPTTLLETVGAKKVETAGGKTVYTSDTLKFYKDADGERVCEIMVKRWFKSDLSDEELLKYLNTPEGRKMFSGIAYRTPTQKQNSIEHFVIKQFLPDTFGDAVIVPSAITNKSGSDFDIDKLTLYLKNIIKNKKGSPKLIELLDDNNSTIAERYYNWVKDKVDPEVKKYIKILSRDVVKSIRDNFKEKFDEINKSFLYKRQEIKDVLYKDLQDNFSEIYDTLENSDQQKYLDKLFEAGTKLFHSLEDETKEDYWTLKQELSRKEAKGYEQIQAYLTLTLRKVEHKQHTDDTSTLEQMIDIYREELRTMGIGEAWLKEHKEKALEKFRENKSNNIDDLISQIDDIRISVEVDYIEAKEEHNLIAAEEMASIGNLPSFDEFKGFDILHQNTKDALENAYIQSMQTLVSSPENFSKLVQPNSADKLHSLADEIVELLGGKPFDYKDVGNMLDRSYMSQLRHAFITGKYAIAIAAVNQTNHSLNQRQAVYIDPERLKIVDSKEREWLGDGKIKFDKHNKIIINGKEYSTLSMIQNAENKDISDIISQFIDGYVDISKGPWIMELGATPGVAGTWLFLVKAGVPIDTVAYFMNQPIIKDYLNTLDMKGYSWVFIKDYIEDMLDKYDSERKDKSKQTVIPSKAELKEMVGKPLDKLNDDQKEQQQFILSEFVKYHMMAKHMFYLTQGTNVDTANFNDPLLVWKKLAQYKRAQNTIIVGADEMMTNSFLGKMMRTLINSRKAISSLLASDRKNVADVLQRVLYPYINMPDRDFLTTARKVVADLFDYAVQIDQGRNGDIAKILIKDKGVAKRIEDFIRDAKTDPDIQDNLVVNSIQIQYSNKANDERATNNIKIIAQGNKVYNQNDMIYAFRELRDYLRRTGKEDLYNDIISLAVLQGGLSRSTISFTQYIPYEDFEALYSKTLDKIEELPGLNNFYKVGAFQRNNWNDEDVVPRSHAQWIKSKAGKWMYNLPMSFMDKKYKHIHDAIANHEIPPFVAFRVDDERTNYNYIVHTWNKFSELITPENLAKFPAAADAYRKDENKAYDLVKVIINDMRKNGDFSYLNKGLFEKVVNPRTKEPFTISYVQKKKDGSSETVYQYVYKLINAWGDADRANEFYDTERKSVIDNGFMETEGMDDAIAIALFEDKSKKYEKIVAGAETPSLPTPTPQVIKESVVKDNTINWDYLKHYKNGVDYIQTLTDVLKEYIEKNNIKVNLRETSGDEGMNVDRDRESYNIFYNPDSDRDNRETVLHELVHVVTETAADPEFNRLTSDIHSYYSIYVNLVKSKFPQWQRDFWDFKNKKISREELYKKYSQEQMDILHASESINEFVASYVFNNNVQSIFKNTDQVSLTKLINDFIDYLEKIISKILSNTYYDTFGKKLDNNVKREIVHFIRDDIGNYVSPKELDSRYGFGEEEITEEKTFTQFGTNYRFVLKNGVPVEGYFQQVGKEWQSLNSKNIQAKYEELNKAPAEKPAVTPKYRIPMNFEDGTGGRRMLIQFTGKSTMELIKEGNRTATSRDRSKSYNQQDIKKGDIIEFYADSGKSKGESVLVRVTKAPYKLSEVTAEEWSRLEGWTPDRFNELKDKGYEQFQFELLNKVPTPPSSSFSIEDNIITFNDGTIVETGNIKLNVDQEKALKDIAGFISSDKGKWALKGYAGTGKTTIINFLRGYLTQTKPFLQVVNSSPTHRANAVMKQKGLKNIRTLHSILGFSPEVDLAEYDASKAEFKPVNKPTMPDGGLLIIDESSMVNDQLYDYVTRLAGQYGTKVLFVGDPEQLKPVNQDHLSKAFDRVDGVSELTIVERTGDNPLLKESMDVRNNVNDGDFSGVTSVNSEGEGVVFTDSQQDFLTRALKLFTSEEFTKNPLLIRIVAATNNVVAEMNDFLRQGIWKTKAENEYNVGEIIMGYSNWNVNRTTSEPEVKNGGDYQVVSATPTTQNIAGVSVKGYNIIMRDLISRTDSEGFIISKDTPTSVLEKIGEEFENLRNKAKSLQKGSKEWGAAWAKFFQFKDSFMTPIEIKYQGKIKISKTLSYGYSHTIHKSQGGTYTYSFVHNPSIESGFRYDKGARKELKYVAITRAEKQSVVLTSKTVPPPVKSVPLKEKEITGVKMLKDGRAYSRKWIVNNEDALVDMGYTRGEAQTIIGQILKEIC